MAGESGTTVKHIILDSTGAQIAVGAGASGAAVVGAPVRVGGSDGTNARDLHTDTSGNQIAVGAAASGSAVTGNPVLIGGSDGTNARTLTTDTAGNLNVIQGESAHATYVASVTGVAFTANTQAIVIEAPSASKVYIRRVVIWNTGTDTSNALVDIQLVRTTTAGTGGAITPAQMDTGDSAYGGIVRASPGTGGTLGTVLFHVTLDIPTSASGTPIALLDFDNGRLGKGPIIPAGTANGIALYLPGTTGGGSFAASIEFSL